MERNFRLTGSMDFKRVRTSGKSYAHPLVVLVALPSTEGRLRVGVTAGRSVGGAVQRNRAKRLLREAMRSLLPTIRADRDVILIARQPLLDATYEQALAALEGLARRASLFNSSDAL